MGYMYVDDSVHDQAGFALTACVYTDKECSKAISDIFENHGFDRNLTEFKSGSNYSKNPKMSDVRQDLRNLFSEFCKFGLVVIPRSERAQLGKESLLGIDQFIKSNELDNLTDIYFDEGLFSSITSAQQELKEFAFYSYQFHFEQDSLAIKGIQLADLAAHTCSIMLKESMGLISKEVRVGENSGYDPDSEVSIGFMMWASLRYNFFFQKYRQVVDDPIIDSTVDVEPFGLYVSKSCSDELALDVRARFGTMYLGCIH